MITNDKPVVNAVVEPFSPIANLGNPNNPSNNLKEKLSVPIGSVIACLLSVLFLRIASRTSYVVLSFYLGENFESAALVVLVIDAFYISELLLAQLVGSLSDRKGRKPFMLLAPVVGSIAAFLLCVGAFMFPRPNTEVMDLPLIALLLIILSGRLLEGTATALNAPANLGYLADVTVGAEKTRVKIMTAFEVATVAGIAMAIPFGGQVSKLFGIGGFVVVIAIYAICFLTIALFMKESLSRSDQEKGHHSLKESFAVIKDIRIWTFVPAWTAVMALIGAWLALVIIVLAYPTTGNYNLKTDEFKKYYGEATLQAPQSVGDKVRVEAIKDGAIVATFDKTRDDKGNIVVEVYKNGKLEETIKTTSHDADHRFPNQLLHGGFGKDSATMIVGGFGLLFIIGMGIWTLLYGRFRRTTMMLIGVAGTAVTTVLLMVINSLADNPIKVDEADISLLWVIVPIASFGVLMLSGFTPAALTHLAAISETLPGKRGAVMGLYSVLLGIGQFAGTILGGIAIDLGGFNGLMIYSLILVAVSTVSVIYMRTHGHDLINANGH